MASAVEPVSKACGTQRQPSVPWCGKRRPDLSNEGDLLGGDPRLCGAITTFLSELSGRGFHLDDGGGCFVKRVKNP